MSSSIGPLATYVGYGEDVENLSDVVVELLCVGRVVLDPERLLQVHVLDQQRVERVDVARDQAPLLLDLTLNLRIKSK